MENLLAQSFIDLQEDFEELLYLYKDYLMKLSDFSKEIERKKSFINFYQETKNLIIINQKELEFNIKIIENELTKINKYKTENDLKNLQDKKNRYFNLIRSKISVYSSLITSTDWQSPSISHSLYSMSGRQTGKIIHTISDYKRDIHLDEKYYENAFLKEYIDSIFKLPIHAYAVSSGMAAFTTVLTFLITEKKIKGKILIGKSIYFQNKELVERFFPDKIIEIDDNNDGTIIKTIKQHKPSVIILDTICNSSDIAMPNLTKVIDFLVKNMKNDIYLIIDNTCLPVYFQPLKLIQGKNRHLSLLLIESLNKYHQFGMDKTTGGIIISYGKDTGKLYYSRQNSGTNISDISIYMLPTPSKVLMKRRIMRFERNTTFLAQEIQTYIDQNPKLSFEKVIYPALSNHPAYNWNREIKFHGSYFSLKFKKNKNNPKTYKKFVKKIIDTAKIENVQIVNGTSFGFNNTRIYLTSLRSDFGTPFVRISIGTENIIEINKIKEVFIKTMSTF